MAPFLGHQKAFTVLTTQFTPMGLCAASRLTSHPGWRPLARRIASPEVVSRRRACVGMLKGQANIKGNLKTRTFSAAAAFSIQKGHLEANCLQQGLSQGIYAPCYFLLVITISRLSPKQI